MKGRRTYVKMLLFSPENSDEAESGLTKIKCQISAGGMLLFLAVVEADVRQK